MSSLSSSQALPAWTNDPESRFAGFLTRITPKVRLAVRRHLQAYETGSALGSPHHFKRLAAHMSRLAPLNIVISNKTLRFHILESSFPRQVFALEDPRQGILRLYMPDVSTLAMYRRILLPPESGFYPLPEDPTRRLRIELLTAEHRDAPDCCKPMLGWGRHAMRIYLSALADENSLVVVERLCDLAAESWSCSAAAPHFQDDPRRLA